MNKLTKRILTANDVIAQVRGGKFQPTAGVFIAPKTRNALETGVARRSQYTYAPDGDNAAKMQAATIEVNGGQCEACANGCLFLAHVARFDSVTLNQFKKTSHEDVHVGNPLAEVFGRGLLNEIECIFEARVYDWHKKFTKAQVARMQAFRTKVTGEKVAFITDREILTVQVRLSYSKQQALLIAIMEKLIDNNGKKLIL